MKSNTVNLIVFDLAGTVVDFGSRAPAAAFCELFRRHGVVATEAEARAPMGMHKRDHIAQMLAMPAIAAQWRILRGRDGDREDAEQLFQDFLPLQLEILPNYAEAIPGVADVIGRLKKAGVKTAATTGYNRPMTSLLLDLLAPQGISFDYSCCAAEVPAGRPRPWMLYRCMEALDIFPPRRVVNVGDTVTDVQAAANAGVWSVGVTLTGNMAGHSREESDRLNRGEAAVLHQTAQTTLREAGADMVLESAAALPRALEAIEYDLSRGRSPGFRTETWGEESLNLVLEQPARAPEPAISQR